MEKEVEITYTLNQKDVKVLVVSILMNVMIASIKNDPTQATTEILEKDAISLLEGLAKRV